jgi:hypothetical protein
VHFKPKVRENALSENELEFFIDGFPIKKSKTAKFLGVVVDEHLSWEPHIAALRRKLNYASATKIRDSIPECMHADLYHTLFESHLTYCISVWGGSSMLNITKIWIAQKYCIRMLFGNKKAYLEKFETCARARPYPLLGTDRISGKVRFRPDIRLHFPVPVPVRQRKTLPDFCRKMFAILWACFRKKFDLFWYLQPVLVQFAENQ